jgi:long-chain acyl-CoA synthetase
MPLNASRAIPWPDVIPYDKQSVPVPGTKRPGQTAHYRNGIWGLTDLSTPNSLKTVDEIFETGLSGGRNEPFLGHRPIVTTNPLKFANYYTWQTWGEVDDRRKRIGSALKSLFAEGVIGGGEYDTVGIWAANRPEWQLVDISCASYQKVSVSIYDTLGKESVEYIVNHAQTSVVFTTADHIPALLKLAPSIPVVKLIVSMDILSGEPKKILGEWAASQNIKFMDFAEFEAYGKEHLVQPVLSTPTTIASICYTSGTTNNPKGVVLTHGNLAIATQGNLFGLSLPDDASILSYLPLAHIYERVCELCVMAVGGKIGYFTGDPLRLLEDAQLLKPNFFPSVPRVLNRIYQAAMTAGDVPGFKGNLFRKAIQVKLDRLRATGISTHAFWDKLVFRKVQAVLGGKIMLVTSGSAPINATVIDFLKIALACEVIEGYGLTETCATCSKTVQADPTAAGTIGPPQPCNEVKLIDVPAMGYTSEDQPNPRGELCIRGANCFAVYYKDEKNTSSTVDDDGWVHTGDVAEIDSVGRLKIVDRVKNIMKLAQGEYVALEKIENLYSTSPVVQQIYVHGSGLESYLIAVVVPDPLKLAAAASSITGRKVSDQDIAALENACKDDRINQWFLNELTKEAKRAGLNGFEIVKRIYMTLDLFSIEDGSLTPTMKIKRKDAYNKHKAELDRLYSLGEPSKL